MNMFARFDENPEITLRVIKETKRYDGRTHARTDNVKTVYPLQTKFAGGIIMNNNLDIEELLSLLPHHQPPHYPLLATQPAKLII